MMQLYQRHIIIHQGKDVQAADSTGRFAFLWPGRGSVSSDPVPCFRHQRDLTPEMPSCLLRGAPACCHAVKRSRGKKLPAFVAGRTFSVVPARYKNVPPGKAQHFADNFQSVTGNRLIISDKSRPGPHCRMPEIRGLLECVPGKCPLDPV